MELIRQQISQVFNRLSGDFVVPKNAYEKKCQNFILKKDKHIIIGKNNKNLYIWLLLWNNISPPSVEYIEKLLIIPNDKIQNKRSELEQLKTREEVVNATSKIVRSYYDKRKNE